MLQTEPRRGAAEGRECDCPPWVLRCAHFGESALWLFDHGGFPEDIHHDGHSIRDPELRYSIDRSDEGTKPCACGDARHIVVSFPSISPVCTDSLPAAEAEFRAREAKLLGGAE